MKIFKILICVAFVLVVSACHGKKETIYDYPDDDPTTAEKGNVGDPCEKNDDCKEGLLCIDKVCSEPVKDEDSTDDSDENPVDDKDDTDTTPTDDADSDTNDPDITPTDDDTDTSSNDEDEPEDTDTQPDEDQDIPEYFPECGNGLRDPGEECDNGSENSDEPGIPGITCRTTCLLARCQDGIVDNGEICDDGNASVGDYCSPDCNIVTGYCGDGIHQSNESCDPGIDPYCSDDCSGITGYCGDGIKQSHEACDKAEPGEGSGEGIGPYYCSVNCKQIIGSCGDGELQLNEACDDGSNNGRYGYCNSTCSGRGPRCGDGKVDIGHEACDDGNTKDGDYCSADCQTSFGSCGDGIKQSFEECDKAEYGDGVGAYCSADCRQLYGRCGDGNINTEAGEECDEGANNNQTYCAYGQESCTLCSRVCKYTDGIPRYCGDGVVSTQAGEKCDKATFAAGTGPYYCSADCMEVIGSCGDGIKQDNETCDPGIDPYCSADCKKSEGSCGDGTRNGNEECDNGSNNGNEDCPYGQTSCQVCTTDCTLKDGTPHYCGNKKVDDGEECDDGPSLNGTYGNCNTNCSGPDRHCGDGHTDSEDGESCDDGKEFNGKYGHCNIDCKGTGAGGYCGDGKIQRESCLDYGENCVLTEGVNEECDDGINDGSYGHCLPGCYAVGQYCGDGEKNGSEECDDGEDNGKYGKCKTDCSGYGQRCGDGIVHNRGNCAEKYEEFGFESEEECLIKLIGVAEVCDDGDNNGKYNQDSPGYCNSSCDGYGEGGFCGDHTPNGTEACDEGDLNGRIPCGYGEESCLVCSTRCRLVNGNTSYCGDGERDPDHEDCDAGPSNGDYNAPCNNECSGVPPKCGDDNIDDTFGEICDDKDLNGTYKAEYPGHCNSNCQGYGEGGYCGDGERNGNETCDTGVLNGNYGGTCSTTCSGTPAYCGDGKIQSETLCTADADTLAANGYASIDDFFVQNGFADAEDCLNKLNNVTEVCDDGENNGQYNKCNTDCSAKLECGDGIKQSEYGEQCDLGAANGTTDQCEYGQENCELCTAYCKAFEGLTSFCGDHIVDTDNDEICDDGKDLNGTYGYCNSNCKGYTKCGDKRIQRKNCGTLPLCNDTTTENCCEVVEDLETDEECDEGTGVNGTYGHCRSDCSGIAECGDGITQEPNEQCDSGFANGTYKNCKDDCSGVTGYCGDGTLQKESCGGAAGCDEISGADEQCDNGYWNGKITNCNYGDKNCYVCTEECKQTEGTTSYCGDGKVDEDYENCDSGSNNGQFGECDITCQETVTWRCGDGNIDALHGEECDWGDGVNGTYTTWGPGTCNSDCKGYGEGGYCGDGIQQPEEACDAGSNNGTPGLCNFACDGICGNGIVEGYETCDDGEENGKYGACNSDCQGYDESGRCGDGKIQKKTAEECENYIAEDPANRRLCSESITENCCEVVEFATGVSSEQYDTGNPDKQNCGVSRCGDGNFDSTTEACDIERRETSITKFFTGESGSMSCSTFPQFSGGTITECNSECMPVLTSCTPNNSYASPFFNTGQTKCYSDSEELDPCPTSGQPFYGQEFNYLEQIFDTTLGSEVIYETRSGLIWQKDIPVSYDGCTSGDECTLTEAQNYCENLDLGGYDDWRLPSAFEFPVIANFETSSHLDSLFTSHDGASFWANEGLVFSTDNGTMTGGHTSAKVKCVRTKEPGNCPACYGTLNTIEYDFALITVLDQTTFVFWYFNNPKVEDSWEGALATCKGIDINGINKMRLPTANELITLIDTTSGGSLIPNFTGKAWTSTTLNSDATQAYVVDFSSLSLKTDSKTNSNFVICVE